MFLLNLLVYSAADEGFIGIAINQNYKSLLSYLIFYGRFNSFYLPNR